ncbi:MAG: RNB domain-containing ribonuclease [Deltaproteobacteria bacterium]|nr:MAG: RNB domain-containing ribonuclease [Deltaproteobacteria bacterium]TMB13988.1 MAG: RNB domain-containing ribonuclease [Deltaproteobacteria bacterium]
MTTPRIDLGNLARQVMIERGFEPDFPADAIRQVAALSGPAADGAVRDLRALAWASIDNDDSRDLDQLTVAEELPGGAVRVLVAIAEVDSTVGKGSPVDRHARRNTTSVYTAARIFPMLPEKLSTDLTSLAAHEERLAVIIEFVVNDAGSIGSSDVYRARVRNQAKLAYGSVGAWLAGEGPMPPAMAAAQGVDVQIRLQDRVAQTLAQRRHEHGALDLEVLEPRAVMSDGEVVDLRQQQRNRATQLIEDFMIAANGVTARYLQAKGFPTLRRVVRSPERWDKLRSFAAGFGDALPGTPDAKALADFLVRRRTADRLRFPDLSLSVVKLLGRGEYVVQLPGGPAAGHFGLAVSDYVHSTAPNRRFPDLVTQRLVKAALNGGRSPYDDDELAALATHCTEQEDAANRVERQVRKSAAALLLRSRIGEPFDAIVTGASEKGTWVRVLQPPVEGKLVHGHDGLDVGDRVGVRLVSVNVERGFIDFDRSG